MRVRSALAMVMALIVVAGAMMAKAVAGRGGKTMKVERRDLLLVVNKGDQTLSVVNPESGEQLAAVPVGGNTGHEVAASPDGRTAFVPIYGDAGVGLPGTDGTTISVIDVVSRTKIATIDLGRAARPHCAVYCSADGKLYVTTELMQAITVIDPATRAVVGSIPTEQRQSHMLAISSDGKRGYTANVSPGTVSAIDLVSKKVLAVIPAAKVVQRIAISADNRWVFTADQAKPQLVVIDTATNTVKTRVPLPDFAFGMTPTHDGRELLITLPASDEVAALDLQTMKIVRVVQVPADPQEILVRPDDGVAYVSCNRSKQVAAISLSTGKIDKLIRVGAQADGLAWAPAKD
jgi:DNA-binding beta-propeller fold protein YncE